jgi:hypothetical protein
MSLMQQMLATHAATANLTADDQGIYEGVVVAGSWIAAESVCQILIGDTVAYESPFFNDGGMNQPLMPICRLETHQIGDQYAPIGGERALAWIGQCGWTCKLVHGPDDTSPVPSGERWIQHRSQAAVVSAAQEAIESGIADPPIPVVWDSALKLTNDGPTTGDGLGGAILGGVGALTQSQTASGARHTIDDTAQKVEAVTQAGQIMAAYDQVMQIVHAVLPGIVQTVIDGLAKKITHQAAPNVTTVIDGIAQKITHQASPEVLNIIDAEGKSITLKVPNLLGGGTIGIGDLFANLPSANGAITNHILATFGSDINSANLQTLINLAVAMGPTGANIPNASDLVPLIVASLIHNVTVPAGSGVVRLAS